MSDPLDAIPCRTSASAARIWATRSFAPPVLQWRGTSVQGLTAAVVVCGSIIDIDTFAGHLHLAAQ